MKAKELLTEAKTKTFFRWIMEQEYDKVYGDVYYDFQRTLEHDHLFDKNATSYQEISEYFYEVQEENKDYFGEYEILCVFNDLYNDYYLDEIVKKNNIVFY